MCKILFEGKTEADFIEGFTVVSDFELSNEVRGVWILGMVGRRIRIREHPPPPLPPSPPPPPPIHSFPSPLVASRFGLIIIKLNSPPQDTTGCARLSLMLRYNNRSGRLIVFIHSIAEIPNLGWRRHFNGLVPILGGEKY